jgi:hypothetical protein
VSFGDVVNAVYPLHERFGREVNAVVLTAADFRARRGNAGFIARVMDGPRIVLYGDADDA